MLIEFTLLSRGTEILVPFKITITFPSEISFIFIEQSKWDAVFNEFITLIKKNIYRIIIRYFHLHGMFSSWLIFDPESATVSMSKCTMTWTAYTKYLQITITFDNWAHPVNIAWFSVNSRINFTLFTVPMPLYMLTSIPFTWCCNLHLENWTNFNSKRWYSVLRLRVCVSECVHCASDVISRIYRSTDRIIKQNSRYKYQLLSLVSNFIDKTWIFVERRTEFKRNFKPCSAAKVLFVSVCISSDKDLYFENSRCNRYHCFRSTERELCSQCVDRIP